MALLFKWFITKNYKRIKFVWKFPKARQTPLMLNHKRMQPYAEGKKRSMWQPVISGGKLPFHHSQMTFEVAVQSNCFLAYYNNNNKKTFQSEGRVRVRVMFMKNLQLLFYLSHMDNSSSSRQRERHKNNIKPITESPLAWAPAIVTIHLPSHSLVRKPYLSHKSLLLRSLYVVRAWVKWLLFNVI